MELTKQDLRDAVLDLKEYTGERIGRVEERVDRINGSIARHERELGERRAMHETLDREFRELRDSVVHVEEAPAVTDDNAPALTKRDVRRAVGFLVAAATIFTALHEVADIAVAWLKAAIQ